jgi:sulfur-oxidizing protein SoxX
MMKSLFGLFSLVAVLSFSTIYVVPGHADSGADVIAEGKKLAVDRKKGNCLACHIMEDGEMPGTQGPPLIFMKQRFADKAKLRARIYDATAFNPNTMMPPFGRHGILTDDEIEKITEYIHTL